jgi:hypothetical protein
MNIKILSSNYNIHPLQSVYHLKRQIYETEKISINNIILKNNGTILKNDDILINNINIKIDTKLNGGNEVPRRNVIIPLLMLFIIILIVIGLFLSGFMPLITNYMYQLSITTIGGILNSMKTYIHTYGGIRYLLYIVYVPLFILFKLSFIIFGMMSQFIIVFLIVSLVSYIYINITYPGDECSAYIDAKKVGRNTAFTYFIVYMILQISIFGIITATLTTLPMCIQTPLEPLINLSISLETTFGPKLLRTFPSQDFPFKPSLLFVTIGTNPYYWLLGKKVETFIDSIYNKAPVLQLQGIDNGTVKLWKFMTEIGSKNVEYTKMTMLDGSFAGLFAVFALAGSITTIQASRLL